jgi:hypothetical protein
LSVTDGVNRDEQSFAVVITPVNDAPILLGLPVSASLPVNRTLEVDFNAIDVDGDALTVTATSSDPGAGTVTLSGLGVNRHLTFKTGGVQPTNTTVTVVAADATLSVTNSFVISVTAPLAPVIGNIPDVIANEDTAVQVPLTVVSGGSNLTVVATSSDPVLVTSLVVVPGTTTTHLLNVTLGANRTGVATIQVFATDSDGSATNSFTLTVNNTEDDPPVLGPVADITTDHNQPVTVALQVFDPDTAIENLTFFTASTGANVISNITFAVTGTNVVMTVTPILNTLGGTAVVTLSVSDGSRVTRTTFNVTVNNGPDAPDLGPIADLTVEEDSVVTIPLTVVDNDSPINTLTFDGTSNNTNLVRSITFTTTATNATAILNLVTNSSGVAAVTIRVSEGTNTSARSFVLTVTDVPEPPVFGPISDITTSENSVVTVPLNITDADNTLPELTYFSATQGTNLVRDIRFNISASAVSATITLKTNATGTERITLSVSDGNTVVRQSFNLIVTEAQAAPVIGEIPDQNVTGGPVLVTFTVTDADTPLSELVIFGAAATTNLVRDIQFAVVGTDQVRATINLVPGATGTDRITVSVSDGNMTTRRSFNLTVGSAGGARLGITAGAGTVTITVTGTSGTTYTIEGSTNLTTWSSVGTVTIGSGSTTGTLQVPSSGPARFFRSRTP